MIKNRTRNDLKQDILSTLGYPIVKVNLTDNHLDNCINAGLKKMWRWHIDGSFENYYKYLVTQEDVDRGYFLVPEYIDAVIEILHGGGVFDNSNWATPEWQMTSSTVLSMNRFLPLNLVDFVAVQQRILNTQIILGRNVRNFEFARLQRRVIPVFDFAKDDILMLRVYELIDPERTDPAQVDSSLMFDNETLKDLSTAYAKQQWGQILKRFSGMTLPGGVVIDGDALIQEGKQDEQDVIERLKGETVDMMVIA